MKPIIVCAAIRNDQGHIICGPRHYDQIMRAQLRLLPDHLLTTFKEQGFVDQFGKFYCRYQAWKIATENQQIKQRVGGDNECLYSENLY